MFKVVGDDIYFKNVKVATFNKLIPSFRDEVEEVIKNNFFTESEMDKIKNDAVLDEQIAQSTME